MSHLNFSRDASTDLFVRDACGEYRTATADEVLQRARQVLARRVRRGTTFSSPQVARDYLSLMLGTREHEVFVSVMLDAQHRLIEVLELFRGTIDGAAVYPREVVKEALARNAAATIFCHNHPSGVAEPSAADRALTERLKTALALVEVRVLDHLVVAGDSVVSFAERGIL
ncbi:RadC family protein [Solimonas terrae]|uniref:DNA repair protein RadC n=1 Tax=Solimonas terrae TaxID=1396819 RepID=A0A6M2BUC1_9GAMM|nr:DNA repair protein RadC [Solimonas terrae]NGY05950.1 DNA repair protein RadC [Solimonas terrae]